MAVPLSIGIAAAASQQKEILPGDVNGDGIVNVNDATLIQKYCAEFETPYPIGEPIKFENEPATQPTTQSTTQPVGDLPNVSALGNENNITLKVWAPDRALALTRQQVAAFKAAYPTKSMNISVTAMGEADAAVNLVNNPGACADVFGFPGDQMDKLEDAQVLSPVFGNFVASVEVNNEAKTVNAAKQSNGLLFAYPETADNTYCLIYNKSVVSDAQAGRLEDVLAACKKAGKKFVFEADNGYYSCIFAFTGGVIIDGYESDGYTQKFVDYNTDEAVKTLQAFSKLMHEYKGTFVSDGSYTIATGFINGTVGAGVDGIWNQAADKNALGTKFGAAKLPTVNVNGTDKQMIPLCGYKYIGVNSCSDYPRTAHALAYYLSGQTCQQQRAEQLGWGPANKAVQNMDAVTSDPVLNAVKDQAAFAVPQVRVAPTFWGPMGNLGTTLMSDSTDPSRVSTIRTLLSRTIRNIRDE